MTFEEHHNIADIILHLKQNGMTKDEMLEKYSPLAGENNYKEAQERIKQL